jgi:hypothetical protein
VHLLDGRFLLAAAQYPYGSAEGPWGPVAPPCGLKNGVYDLSLKGRGFSRAESMSNVFGL